jgi:hypothetical protein
MIKQFTVYSLQFTETLSTFDFRLSTVATERSES